MSPETTTETVRPQWQAMTVTDFHPKPQAAQVALFAAGDDGYGTGSLFSDDGDEPTYF